MKRTLFWLFVFALAALNWAALHDILKGEQDVWLEWMTIVVSITLMFVWVGRRILQNDKH